MVVGVRDLEDLVVAGARDLEVLVAGVRGLEDLSVQVLVAFLVAYATCYPLAFIASAVVGCYKTASADLEALLVLPAVLHDSKLSVFAGQR